MERNLGLVPMEWESKNLRAMVTTPAFRALRKVTHEFSRDLWFNFLGGWQFEGLMLELGFCTLRDAAM